MELSSDESCSSTGNNQAGDQRPKYENGSYKTPRGKHREDTLRNHRNIFLDLSPRVMEIKTENKQR